MVLHRISVAVAVAALVPLSVVHAQATAEDSVRALEAARAQAVLSGDTVALSRMLAPDFNEISRIGTVRSRADNIRDVASGRLHLTMIRQDSLTVRIFGDVAVLQGIAYNEGTFAGTPFSGRIRYTRVFVRHEGRWQAITMQQTMTQ